MFKRLLWSFQFHIVNFKKRPTKLWCLIQPGLVPFSQIFVVHNTVTIIYISYIFVKTYLEIIKNKNDFSWVSQKRIKNFRITT